MSASATGASPYDAPSFEAFWPSYVRMHTRPETQVLHAVATLSAITLVAAGVVTMRPSLVVLAPVVDYAVAQTSHRVFEKNRTTPWRHHAWHARAELRMLWLVLRGRMRAEVARHGAVDA